MTKHSTITKSAPTTTNGIQYFPLTDLYVSDLNPRKDLSTEGVELLAQSILACGLIQNLAGLMDEAGKVAIVAGGRRLRALDIAAHEKSDLALVPVRLAPSVEVAMEWANAENTAREDLNPVDEIRAYGDMAKSHMTLPQISQSFGVTEAHVRKRLALADLPNQVLDAVASGDLSMGLAKVMTVCSDEKKILEALTRATDGHFVNEHTIKQMLAPDSVTSTERRAAFVGQETYVAAGGTITQDLFKEETLFNDVELLDELFLAKLEQYAKELLTKDGWAWVMTAPENHVYWYEQQSEHGFARTYKIEGVLTEEQAARSDELTSHAENDALDDAGREELAQLEAIQEGEYSKEQKALSGVVVHVGHNGKLEVIEGLVRKEDATAAIEAGVIKASQHDTNGCGSSAKEKPAYSQKFRDDMQAIRLAAVQTALLEKPELVLDVLAFALSPASGYYNSLLSISFQHEQNKPEIDDGFTLDGRIGGELSEAQEIENDAIGDLAHKDQSEAFKAFRELGKKNRNTQITEAFAQSLKTSRGNFMACIEAETGADIRAIWTPTVENCFKRLKSAQLDAIFMTWLELDETSDIFKGFAKSKKGEKNIIMHKLVSDQDYRDAAAVTKEQAALIDQWVPDCF